MSIYDYWINSDGNSHKISEMDDRYIRNCLGQLRVWNADWHGITPEQLTADELARKDEVGMKAWYAFHGISYINAFEEELERRKEAKS